MMFLVVGFLFVLGNRYCIYRLNKISDRYEAYLSKQDIMQMTNKLDIEVIESNTYAYNPATNSMRIIQKEAYSLLDVLSILHEYGHYLDNQNKCIQTQAFLNIINMFCVTPCVILAGIFRFRFAIGIVGIYFLLALYRIYFLYKYEKSASDYALAKLHYQPYLEEYATYAMYSQIMTSLAFFVSSLYFVENILR